MCNDLSTFWLFVFKFISLLNKFGISDNANYSPEGPKVKILLIVTATCAQLAEFIKSNLIWYITRKHCSRMRTACFCGGWDWVFQGVGYPQGVSGGRGIWVQRYPTPMGPEIPYSQKGHVTRDTLLPEGTCDQRYPTPRRDMWPEIPYLFAP